MPHGHGEQWNRSGRRVLSVLGAVVVALIVSGGLGRPAATTPVTARPPGAGNASETARDATPASARVVARIPVSYDVVVLSLSPDGRYVATNSARIDSVTIWDTRDGSIVRTLGGEGVLRAVAFSADGRQLAAGRDALPPTHPRMISIWDVGTGTEVLRLRAPIAVVRNVAARVAFSPDGHYLASRHENHVIGLYDLRAKKWARTVPARADFAGPLAFRGDSQRLAFGVGLLNESYSAQEIDVRTARVVTRFQGCAGVTVLAYSADGRSLAIGDHHGTICIHRAETGALEHRLRHGELVQFAAFAASGRHFVSAAGDGTVRIWDTGAWRVVDTLSDHDGRLYSAAVSRDGRRLATGGAAHVTVREFSSRIPPRMP